MAYSEKQNSALKYAFKYVKSTYFYVLILPQLEDISKVIKKAQIPANLYSLHIRSIYYMRFIKYIFLLMTNTDIILCYRSVFTLRTTALRCKFYKY